MSIDPRIKAVRDELRRGGRPAQVYMDQGFGKGARDIDVSLEEHVVASSLTTAILINYEDRLHAIEAWIDTHESPYKVPTL